MACWEKGFGAGKFGGSPKDSGRDLHLEGPAQRLGWPQDWTWWGAGPGKGHAPGEETGHPEGKPRDFKWRNQRGPQASQLSLPAVQGAHLKPRGKATVWSLQSSGWGWDRAFSSRGNEELTGDHQLKVFFNGLINSQSLSERLLRIVRETEPLPSARSWTRSKAHVWGGANDRSSRLCSSLLLQPSRIVCLLLERPAARISLLKACS